MIRRRVENQDVDGYRVVRYVFLSLSLSERWWMSRICTESTSQVCMNIAHVRAGETDTHTRTHIHVQNAMARFVSMTSMATFPV